MKKLDNFIFDEKINENLKAFVVFKKITNIPKDKLVFEFDNKNKIFDILFTLLFLHKVNLEAQIVVSSVSDFETLLAKFYLWSQNKIPEELRNFRKEEIEEFEKFLPYLSINEDIKEFYLTYLMIKTLRKLCPWDREQTHESLIPEIVEEPLELFEEIKKGNTKGMEEELGDVLLQILLHSEIGTEENLFSLKDVSKTLFKKMYERHPHVFKENKAKSPKEVLYDWEKNKKKKETLNISKILASFITTIDIQEEAKFIGLEFRNVNEIYDKIEEELNEVKNSKENIKEEIGDLLFSVINLARFLNIDPAHALFISYEKFMKRVKKFKSLDEKEKLDIDKAWEKVKKDEQRDI